MDYFVIFGARIRTNILVTVIVLIALVPSIIVPTDARPGKKGAKCGRTCRLDRCPVASCVKGQIKKKDLCNCCAVCVSKVEPTPALGLQDDNACKSIKCPKSQVCVLNIQGLPMCRCPLVFSCPGKRGGRDKKQVCGKDGVTYKSRCHLKIAECIQDSKIRVSHKGVCPLTDDELASYSAPKQTLGKPSKQEGRTNRRAKKVAQRQQRKQQRIEEREKARAGRKIKGIKRKLG